MRIIDTLRHLYGGKWTYDSRLNRWDCDKGWYVYPVSQMAPRYDGDDNSFETVYCRSDNGHHAFSRWLVKNAH
jgi:hypothetical protein